MWPTLSRVLQNLPDGSQVKKSAAYDQSIVSGSYIWDGNGAPKLCSGNQLLLAEPDKARFLLRWSGQPLSNMTALLSHPGLDDNLSESLLQRGISVVLLPPALSLEEASACCNDYILRYVSRFLQGEMPNNIWPPMDTLYFSSHFENILNGLQYLDTYGPNGSDRVHMLPKGPYQLLLLRVDRKEGKGTEDYHQQLCTALLCMNDELRQLFGNQRFPVSVRDEQNVVCLLGSNPAYGNANQFGNRRGLSVFAGKIRSRYAAVLPDKTISAVFSPIFNDLRLAFSSYQECLFSGSLYREMYGTNYTLCSEDMSLYFHLLQHMDHPHITRQFERCWALLQEYDLQNKSELCTTLEVFLKCNGRNAEASEALDIHRNTMHNRLLSIERVLNMNLSNPETLFYLSLCLRLKLIGRAATKYDYFSAEKPTNVFNESVLPVSWEIRQTYDMLSQHTIGSNTLLGALRAHGLQDVTVSRVAASDDAYSDFLRIVIHGSAGKLSGKHAPTVGVVGRLSGIKLQSQPLSLVSDADGAIAAIALALKLAALSASGEGPLGDVIITTQLALQSSTSVHQPAPLTMSPVDTATACRMEVDPQMDAVLSIAVCRATHWVNTDGIAVTPPVKEGIILPPCDSLLHLMESVTGARPVVFPISSYDITPANNGLYHVNSIMQPSLATTAPVVGLALTSVNLVPGITPRHNDLLDVELAIRFALEIIYGFTAGNLSLYDPAQFERAKKMEKASCLPQQRTL